MMVNRGQMPKEARRYLMQVIYKGRQAESRFWIGLAESPGDPTIEPTLDLLTRQEPAGGYGRQQVNRQDWTLTPDLVLESPELFFTNLSEERWRTVDIAFLATSPDDSGVLLAWGFLQDGHYTLNPRNQLHFPYLLQFD